MKLKMFGIVCCIHDNTGPDVKGGMYPAVVIQHFALYPAACLTIDRVSEILLGHANDAGAEEQAHRDSVVEPEHEVVDGDDIGLDHGLDVAGDVHHDITVSLQGELEGGSNWL